MKIVFFGDSLTQGTLGVSFVDKIAKALPGHPIVNRGVNGDTSLNLYRRVDRDVIAGKPDAVFVMVGVNDAISTAEPGMRIYYRLAKGVPQGHVPPLALRENMRAVLSKLIASGITVWTGLPPLEYSPGQAATMREMNERTLEVCRELKVPVLDLMRAMNPVSIPERARTGMRSYSTSLWAMFRGPAAYERMREAGGFTYSFDGIHLTEAGAERAAGLILRFLGEHGVR